MKVGSWTLAVLLHGIDMREGMTTTMRHINYFHGVSFKRKVSPSTKYCTAIAAIIIIIFLTAIYEDELIEEPHRRETIIENIEKQKEQLLVNILGPR
jgi:hypothetical protein